MKTLKITTILLCFLFSPLFSCSEESQEQISAENLDVYKTPDFFERSVTVISEEIKRKVENSKGNEQLTLTQAELDNYVQISGYNGPLLTLSQINHLINQTLDLFDSGEVTFPLDPIDDYNPISEKTNDLLFQITTIGSISNLKNNPNYLLISPSEQNLVFYINNLVEAWENGEIDFGLSSIAPTAICSIYDGTGNGGIAPCWVAGMLIGGYIGFQIGGGVGIIIGGIIGGVVGALAGTS